MRRGPAIQATISATPEVSAPSTTGAEFRRRGPAAAVAAQHDGAEVFVPTIPKSDATLAMLENAVKGQLPLYKAYDFAFPCNHST